MGCDRSTCRLWCGCIVAVFTAAFAWLCHGAWFCWRLAAGKIHIDVGDAPAVSLYFSIGVAWDGLVVGVLAGVAAYLAFRHWLCPLRLSGGGEPRGQPVRRHD